VLLAGGCASSLQTTARPPEPLSSRSPQTERAAAAPGGPRLVPASIQSITPWGVERDGSMRGLVAGVRVIVRSDGSIRSASDILPSGPTDVAAVPERMGGGILFSVRRRIWQSDDWLGAVRPWVATGNESVKLFVGLDRVYAWRSGWLAAIDPRTGLLVDRGPIPSSPAVTQIAALDAWRAAAIADMRGAVMTFDAGATWLPVALPVDPILIATLPNSFAIEGADHSWWEVGPEGPPSLLEGAPTIGAGARTSAPGNEPRRPLGAEPLAAAVADGWPLADGVALVARDGSAFRVSTVDGSLLETMPGAFALGPSRCRGISLASPDGDPDAFGFVCGLARGWTAIYRWDPLHRAMVELKSFSEPRQVLAFANGALAVRGGCRSPWSEREGQGPQPWCVKRADGDWRSEVVPRADDHLVVLSDGRLVVVEPPRGGNMATLQLVVIDGPRARKVPVSQGTLPDGALDALKSGVWLDGFEERRPGILGGWVNFAPSALGVEIALDGTLRVGEFMRDCGAPIVSGRWGLGWTASRRGFETTDGGMTWRRLELPEPLGVGSERACGPLGCVIGGWIRVGWGGPMETVVDGEPQVVALGRAHAVANINLRCDDFPNGARMASLRPTPSSDSSSVTISVPGDARKVPRNAGMARVRTWRESNEGARETWRWTVEWISPWGGATDSMSSSPSVAPWTDIASARRALGTDGGRSWTVVPSSAPEHAILIAQGRHDDSNPQVFLLQADRQPVEVVRADRQPIGAIEDSLRVGGRWIFATAQGSGQPSSAVVWTLDEGVMRELARLPRSVLGERAPVRLARRSDADAVGLMAEGQVDASSRRSPMWVTPIALGSGVTDEPQELAPVTRDASSVPLCSLEDPGWVVDMPYAGVVRIVLDGRWTRLYSPLAQLRISRTGWCLEAMLGSPESAPERPAFRPSAGIENENAHDPMARRTIVVGAVSPVAVRGLRCWQPSM
jgi:hypothetical protein